MVYSNTLIEPDKWEEIRKKLYFPVDEDEYSNSSKPLTDVTCDIFINACPVDKKPLKKGYITDLCRNGGISPCALILGLIYIRRLSLVNPSYLNSVSSNDMFLIAMVVASKYLQDEGETEALVNSEWAEISQKCKTSLDSLERDFLQAINWQLYVSMKEYYNFISTVEGRIACIEASRRGWWSYTDLVSFWEVSSTPELMINTGTQTTKVVAGSLTLYLVCLTALMSTSHVAMETSSSPSIQDPYWSESGHKLAHSALTQTVMNMDLEMVQDSVLGLGICPLITWNHSHCIHDMDYNCGNSFYSNGRHGNETINNDSSKEMVQDSVFGFGLRIGPLNCSGGGCHGNDTINNDSSKEMVQDSVFGFGLGISPLNCIHDSGDGCHGNETINNTSFNILLYGEDEINLVPFGTTNYNNVGVWLTTHPLIIHSSNIN